MQHIKHSEKTVLDSCLTNLRYVWDLFLHKDIEVLESMQMFAIRLCSYKVLERAVQPFMKPPKSTTS